MTASDPKAAREHAVFITNTLTGKKERFEPLHAPDVKLYVCGLTVYDYVHIGHARTYVAWDVIRRYLERRGFRVTHVQNVTDVDDKIIARAKENGEDPIALARRFTDEADKDLDALAIRRAHHYPRVSDNIEGILAMTKTLIDNGHAYVGRDEHGNSVYFSVASDPDYGKLSHLNRDQMLEGVRKDVTEGKRDAADFALWKAAKPGEVSWPSPWGPGRPGWHIECSVMSTSLLGASFDIHGGGMDLTFPHHENEIAQSESATGVTPFVRYWVHTGFLTVEGEKMSKSLGNFITLRAALAEWQPEVLRLWFAGTHYRSAIDYSETGLAQAAKNVERIANALGNIEHAMKAAPEPNAKTTGATAAMMAAISKRRHEFDAAMDDDFNTPLGLAALLGLVSDVNVYLAAAPDRPGLLAAHEALVGLGDVLGVIAKPASTAAAGDVAPLLDLLLEARQAARAKKDFATSDRIRDRLAELGYVIEDAAGGPKWRRKS
ncbi:MAG: cysteine--tRNA ligase [Thermoplasmatota archaeon]